MEQYTEFILLGILLILFYNKPKFTENLYNNKLAILVLVLLNAYIAKTCGISSGIIMACIIIVLIDKKGRRRISANSAVADGVGFEPTRRSHACRFSRPVPSTARPTIRKNEFVYRLLRLRR